MLLNLAIILQDLSVCLKETYNHMQSYLRTFIFWGHSNMYVYTNKNNNNNFRVSSKYACVYVCMYECMHVFRYALCAYVCMHICMFVFTVGGFVLVRGFCLWGFCPGVYVRGFARGLVRFPVQFVQPLASEFCIHN